MLLPNNREEYFISGMNKNKQHLHIYICIIIGKLFGPVFLHRPHHCLRATAGYTVEISCVVRGNPAPRVWWTKDNVTISGGRGPQVILVI